MRALDTIRQLDYTVVYVRDMARMREFYSTVLGFPLMRELGPQWVEYRVGANILAFTERGLMFNDPAPPRGVLSVQLAFRVSPSDVARCAEESTTAGVTLLGPPTDQPWHRTVFFRDPDGKGLEIYAEI